MQKLLLAEGMHVCVVDNGIVFLDLRANRYFALPTESVAVLEERLQGFTAVAQDVCCVRIAADGAQAIVDSLVARGVLTSSWKRGHPAAVTRSMASRAIPPGLPRQTKSGIRVQHVAAFTAAYLWIFVGMQTKRLPQIVSRLRLLHASVTATSRRDSQSESRSNGGAKLADLLGIFQFLRTFVYTAHDQCLFNALVLTSFLDFFAVDARFYVGVRTTPFLAHAWVEVGDYVVDDRLESLQGLTPLLVA